MLSQRSVSRDKLLPVLGLVALALTAPALAQSTTLRVGLHDADPVAFRDEGGEPRGFMVEVLNYIAEKEGWRIEYVYGSWSDCLTRLERGEIDLLFPILRTNERLERLDFSTVPMFATWGQVFGRSVDEAEGVLDLEGRTIHGVENDRFFSALQELVQRFDISATFEAWPTKQALFTAAGQGTAQLIVIESVAGHMGSAAHGLAPTPLVFQPSAALVAVPKGRHASILATLDQQLTRLKQDPGSVYFRAYESWLGVAPRGGLPGWVKWVAGGAALLLATLAVFSALLRREVRRKTRQLVERNERLEREIEQRSRLEEQLRHTQRLEAMGALSAGLAHDFTNLLMVIAAHLEDLRTAEKHLEGPQREALTVINEAVAQANGVTRSLLTFSRRAPSDKRPIPLGDVVETTARMLRRTLPARIDLQVELGEAPWVNADDVQLQQVLVNLALNARDAISGEGSLRIEVAAENDHASLRVIDSGTGMDAEQRLRAFEPFYTTKPRRKGTGLGLSIVHGIVAGHGGTVSVESHPGSGSRFEIRLPTVAAEPVAPQVSVGENAPRRILLAEHQQQIREVLATYLTGEGYQIEQVADGQALLQVTERLNGHVDLLVLDQDLPGCDTLAWLQQLRDAADQTPAVLMTARHESAVSVPAVRTLAKPFQLQDLGELVDELISQE